jgi:hypothetical protein
MFVRRNRLLSLTDTSSVLVDTRMSILNTGPMVLERGGSKLSSGGGDGKMSTGVNPMFTPRLSE